MFKRPFEHKNKAPVRSSDLRRLREEVQAAFQLEPDIAKQAVPDHILTCKAETHLGEPVVLYEAQNGDPRWFRLGKATTDTLVPTCYTFDVVPNLLPTLVTAQAVVTPLIQGAALFSQGVSDKSLQDLPDDMRQGQLVAIAAGPSNTIVAVGTLADSKQALMQDRKGKAVMTLHARGDFLWASGSGEQPSSAAPDDDETSTTSKKAGKQKQRDHLDAANPSKKSSKHRHSIRDDDDDDDDNDVADKLASASLQDSSTAGSQELDGAEVDRILRNALLLAIAQTLSKDSSLLPMTASALYSTYVLPYRPAGTPSSADIKKSSKYKKLAQFIKAMTKEGLITSKEVRNELMVMSVNGEHLDVSTLRPYKTLASGGGNDGLNGDGHASQTGPSGKDTAASDVTVKELYKATSTTLPVFQAVDHDRPELDLYTAHEIKKILSTYYGKGNLVHPRDQKYITPDDALSAALLKRDEAVDVLSKDDAHKRFLNACQSYWVVQRPGQDNIVKKGSPPIVKVVIKNVGKRQVTLVSNHEAWADVGLFTSEELSEELKKRSASSTSSKAFRPGCKLVPILIEFAIARAVQPLAGSAKKNQQPKVEIMCQGTHNALVSTLLKERGVPTKYIDVDLSKSRK
ncbi:hypothetical protein OIV83_003820 [Microbotryomycetes sp. JL201]|nr:hypothetical protein OIV83_003820 [Microbotryomycetes sp. JL201]